MSQIQPASSMIAAFNGIDFTKVEARTGGARWTPPAQNGLAMAVVGAVFTPDGMKWTDATTKQEMSKPTLQFEWAILEGEFAGKNFYDEKYVISPPPTNPNHLKGWESEMGRLKGVLQVITGQDVLDVALSLANSIQIITDSGGQFPVRGNVTKFKPKPTEKNPNPFEKTHVYVTEAIAPATA